MPVKRRKGGSSQDRRRARRASERLAADLAAHPRGHLTIDEAADAIVAAASGSTSLPLSDRDTAWDAGAAAKSLSVAQLAKAFFWRDPDGDAKTKAAYKLGFASAESGTLTAIWRGVTAAAGAVQGARGGVQIPEADVAGVKAKIAGYYRRAAKAYGDDGIKPPWEADEANGQNAALLLAYAETDTSTLDVFHAEDGVTVVGVGGSGPEMDAFLERRAFWGDLLAPELSPERAALALARDALAVDEDVVDGACADCGHGAEQHAGDDNMGACTVAGCDCEGFVPSPEMGRTTIRLAVTEAARAEALKALLAGTVVTSPDGEPTAETDALLETFQLRFDEFVRQVSDELDASTADLVPADLQPGETLPAPNPSPPAPEAQPTRAAQGLRWVASFVPEATLTDDGRAMAPGSISWRELPLTLMGLIVTDEGHKQAEVCGRVDEMWREGNMVKAAGVFDTGEFGQEIARMVGDGVLRGVSVDLAIQAYEVGPRSNWFDGDGNWAPKDDLAVGEEPSLVDILMGDTPEEEIIYVVTDGVIGASTVCPFPAFADATIALAASLVADADRGPALWTVTQQAGFVVTAHELPEETLVASAGPLVEATPLEPAEPVTAAAAGLAPLAPPADWFTDPALEELTPLTVTDEGRIFGHAAAWDVCHIGIPEACTTAPHSEAGNAYFHLGEIVCADGERPAIGKITMGTGHADRRLGWREAAAHYDDTGTVVADVISGEDEHGIWVSGALRPNVDAERARELRAATLSGDWRDVNGNLELIAILAVNVPGFPVPRVRALVAAGEDGGRVLALVAAGVQLPGLDDAQRARIADLRRLARIGTAERERFAELAALARAEG